MTARQLNQPAPNKAGEEIDVMSEDSDSRQHEWQPKKIRQQPINTKRNQLPMNL